MNALNAFRHGVHEAAGRGRLAALLYSAHLVLALPAAFVFQAALGREFGGSLAPERLLSGFDFTVWMDFMGNHGDVLRTLMQMAASTGLLALVLGPFLAGGTMAMLGPGAAPFSTASFFRHCGAFYFRFLRLTLIFGGLALLALAACGAVLGGILSGLDKDALSELPLIMAGTVGIVLILVLVVLIFLAGEYAKIAVFRQNSRTLVRAAVNGFDFLLRNFPSVAGLQLLTLFALALLALLYLGLDRLLGGETLPGIFLLVLTQQAVLYGRVLIRVTGLSAQMAIFEDRRRQPLILYGWDDSRTPSYDAGERSAGSAEALP